MDQAKTGWGAKNDGLANQGGSVGVAVKSAAANYWDNKTEELDIPEMDDGGAVQMTGDSGVSASAPPVMENKMIDLAELNKEFSFNVPSTTQEGIDISLLTCQIRPIIDLIETDMFWDYQSLQAEIGQSFRERYGKSDAIEGTVANNL